jgi:hypothetical protein
MDDTPTAAAELRTRAASISDYLPAQADPLVDAAERLENRAEATHVEAAHWRARLTGCGIALSGSTSGPTG